MNHDPNPIPFNQPSRRSRSRSQICAAGCWHTYAIFLYICRQSRLPPYEQCSPSLHSVMVVLYHVFSSFFLILHFIFHFSQIYAAMAKRRFAHMTGASAVRHQTYAEKFLCRHNTASILLEEFHDGIEIRFTIYIFRAIRLIGIPLRSLPYT